MYIQYVYVHMYNISTCTGTMYIYVYMYIWKEVQECNMYSWRSRVQTQLRALQLALSTPICLAFELLYHVCTWWGQCVLYMYMYTHVREHV